MRYAYHRDESERFDSQGDFIERLVTYVITEDGEEIGWLLSEDTAALVVALLNKKDDGTGSAPAPAPLPPMPGTDAFPPLVTPSPVFHDPRFGRFLADMETV